MNLLWIGLKARWFFFFEYCKAVWKYYRNFSFAKVDLLLVFSYLFRNPFKISQHFLKERGEEDIYAYGETPLTTLEEICEQCAITEKDFVYELGCGRGRTCFWLNQWLGCRVVGVDYVPDFINRAKTLVKSCQLEEIEFRLEDIAETQFNGVTVIYLFGTCLDEETIRQLIHNLAHLEPGVKIISISYPLTDFDDKKILEFHRQFKGKFSWGESDIYLQVVRSR